MTDRLLRFGAVGVVGYLVDTGLLLLLVQAVGLNHLAGRVLSFLAAASVTFVLHHYFTFRVNGRLSAQRWTYYLVATSVGALINVAIYHLWVLKFGVTSVHLALGTAVGSIVAMCVNYLASSTLVFRHVRTTTRTAKSALGDSRG